MFIMVALKGPVAIKFDFSCLMLTKHEGFLVSSLQLRLAKKQQLSSTRYFLHRNSVLRHPRKH